MARIDTPMEAAYYEHGGILQYVLRLASRPPDPRFRPIFDGRPAIPTARFLPRDRAPQRPNLRGIYFRFPARRPTSVRLALRTTSCGRCQGPAPP